MPIASTVSLSSPETVDEGSVVIVDEELGVYSLSEQAVDSRFYGVTAERPPVVFSTGTNTVPVVTEGVTRIRVSTENGSIARGDLLVSSSQSGIAMRADEEDRHVFAIALEAYSSTETVGLIQAEVGPARAQALRDSRKETEEEGSDNKTSLIRGAISTVLAVGALLFILYSFRSAIVQTVTSVGRNPRARIPIMTLSLANIIFALLLCVVVIFVAIAILVLPL